MASPTASTTQNTAIANASNPTSQGVNDISDVRPTNNLVNLPTRAENRIIPTNVSASSLQYNYTSAQAAYTQENPDDTNGLYTAVIGEIKTDAGTIGKGEKAGQPWAAMLVPVKLQLPPGSSRPWSPGRVHNH